MSFSSSRPADLGTSQTEGNPALESLDRLLEVLGSLVSPDAVSRAKAMQMLAHFFRADAAGLFMALQPGRPMQLLDSCGFPASAPLHLGSGGTIADGRADSRSVVQMRMVDTGSGVWSVAAGEAGWQELLLFTLPRCPGRLMLAYRDTAPKLSTELVNPALRALALAAGHHQVQGRVDGLSQRKDEIEHLLTAGLNFINEGVVLLDHDGKVISCNVLCGKLLGYTADEVIGLPAEGVLASRSDVKRLVQRVLTGESALEERQLILYHRYGEPLAAHLKIAPLRLLDRPEPYGAIALFSDRRSEPMEEVEKNLREKNAQLERMVSILAHEIRNPLGSIKAGLEYLQPTLGHDEGALQDLETIQGEIGRLDRLLRDALLVSRSSEPQLGPQFITEVLDDLLTGRKKLLDERGILVRKNYQPNLPRVDVDRVQMEQVFDNLIVNAIHAMSTGGYLNIAVGTNSAPSGAPLECRSVMEIKIGDSGIGIPPELQTRIFDPFFTTKKGGTGLGLAVARRIVGQHNGTLAVESWPDVGTIFTITLPVEDELDG